MYNLINLLGIQSIDEFKTVWPEWYNKMDEVSKQLKIKKGADPSQPDVAKWIFLEGDEKVTKRQKHHADQTYK